MIFWIFVSLTIALFCLSIFLEDRFYNGDWDVISMVMTVLSLFVSVIMLIVIIWSHVGISAKLSANEELYKSLVYKSQTESIRDELGLVNKEYIDEVQNWNINVVTKQGYQRDFWIGIFYPNIYDNLKTIDLNSITYREEKE